MQTIANLLTIIVALCAIGLSLWEGYETRRYNRLSVLPRLEPANLFRNEDSLYTIRYAVENTGLGPAVVQNFIVFRDSTGVFDTDTSSGRYSFLRIREELEQLPFHVGAFTRAYVAGEMLEAGEEHLLIDLWIPSFDDVDSLDYSPQRRVRDEVLDKRSFVLCYCSVYGEDCGMTFLGAPPPEESICGF